MVVAPTAIKVASATEDGAICQVEPQVLSHVTLGALPATSPGRRKLAQLWVGVYGSGNERGVSRPLSVQQPIFSLLRPLHCSSPPYLPSGLAPYPLSYQLPDRDGLFTPPPLVMVPHDKRSQVSPGRDPSRVVQLLEVEGMLRHLTDFPIPSLYLLLPRG